MTATAEESVQLTRTLLTEVVIPVYNEERVLADSVHRLHDYLSRHFPYPFLITIAESGSVDATPEIGAALARELPNVRLVRIAERGRGLALRQAWETSDADVVSYMDADLSIDLDGFLPLIAPLASGHSDLSIGTRHRQGSSVQRSLLRAVLSRTYNLLLRVVLGVRFSDAQCGFKAGRREVVQALLPVVQDNRWFFDTELLCVAQRYGLRIHEVPVDCLDDPDSKVRIASTVLEMLRGMVKVTRRRITGTFTVPLPAHLQRAKLPPGLAQQFVRFATVGALSGLLHVGFYLAFRTVMSPLAANALGLFLTTVLNTAANRRVTFGIRGHRGALRHQLEAGVAFLLSLVFSSAGLLAVGSGLSRAAELAVLFAGDALATLVRFTLLRNWVFAPHRQRGDDGGPAQ
ncbi:Glycosyltransferase, catalytic subunit of cellulose synthase and poly-beta-1,6-N-acetylglucosamine synthase [Micromonospora nigra]|uniref:dolichyl-phosphate beta-glucosyltransferase n=1 Tax=Micromonospora nigra TaxID=145857 RepID=A0A1C6SY17_9ACTN|nr:bifunctional glycosyltransferase family 2/GtrA family protein [Micromonospora nigra]SCL34446.1 Glycosyltransferase, catalytic subunit of cellulose synthase and poly-beta-1,6-N-acetylglucosamine synthase [Micromonospora nigra]